MNTGDPPVYITFANGRTRDDNGQKKKINNKIADIVYGGVDRAGVLVALLATYGG